MKRISDVSSHLQVASKFMGFLPLAMQGTVLSMVERLTNDQ